MKDSLIFLIGSTGFIGRNLVDYFESNNLRYISLSRSVPVNIGAFCLYHFCSPLSTFDFELLTPYFSSYSVVVINAFGTGVRPNFRDWDSCFDSNIVQLSNLFIRVSELGVSKIVNIGSAFEYGSSFQLFDSISSNCMVLPDSAYACTKAYSALLLSYISSFYSIPSFHIRPCVVYGRYEPSYRLYPSILSALENGTDLNLTAGTQIRGFLSVDSLIQKIFILLALDTLSFHIVDLPGDICTVRDFTTRLWTSLGCKGDLHFGSVGSRPNESNTMNFIESSYPCLE